MHRAVQQHAEKKQFT